MLQTIKSKLPEAGLKLDPRLALGGMAAIAGLLAVAVVFYLWRDSAGYRPLYGAGEGFAAAEVMQVLDGEQLAYRLHPQTGQVLVRDDQLARARMLLAAKGVKVAVPAGYELFDKDEPLGTSQFVQDVRLKRSLEGELARTVMGMEGLQQARVHLALEEGNSFVVSRREPAKASVMLQLAPGFRMKPEQVGAIVNLLAASVPTLKPENVKVVDQQGTLLSRGLDAWGGSLQNWQVVDEYKAKAVANIEEVLAPVLGNGNFRISVAADMDFSQKEETFQAYGDSPRVRNEVLRDESTLDKLALGIPGSLANRPPVAVAEEEGQTPPRGQTETETRGATSLRKETNRQLDYDQSVTHIKHAPFALRQQSIAVVLNAAAAPEGGFSAEARSQFEAMVKSAVGYNASRGDSLTLSVLPFAATAEGTFETPPWWETDKLYDMIKLGVAAFISLLLLLMVVRPAMRSLTRSSVPALPPAEPLEGELSSLMPAALNPQAMAERMLANQPSQQPHGLGVFSELNPLAEIRLPAPGSGLEMQIEHLQMLAKNDPERVSEVIKQWIGRHDRELHPAG